MCASALLAGADVGTMPTDIFKKLLSHPLTDKGLAAFVADAKKANVTIKAEWQGGMRRRRRAAQELAGGAGA